MKKNNEYNFAGIYNYGEYRVEIIRNKEDHDVWEAWLNKAGYGHKMYMFGIMAEDTSLAEMKDIVEGNLDNEGYATMYEDEIVALEDACEFSPSLEADERLVEIYDRTYKNCEFYEREKNYPALLNEIGCLRGIAYSIEQVAGRDCLDECVDYDAYRAMIGRAQELKNSLDNTSNGEIK